MVPVTYPFVPKSTGYLEPGQFWSIPLDSGRFACGRVMQMRYDEAGKRDSRCFLAGLLDWSGDTPPSSEAIAGCGVIAQGDVHIKTIRENGGAVLGHRPLEADKIEPWLFRSQSGCGAWLQRGYDRLRRASRAEEDRLPVFSTWGYGVIKLLAEKHFGLAPHSSSAMGSGCT